MELIANIIIGLITGLYSGIIVSRSARFSVARSALVRSIQEVGYRIDHSAATVMGNPLALSGLYYAMAEFVSLGHATSVKEVEGVDKELIQALKDLTADPSTNGQAKFNNTIQNWQRKVMNLKPDWCQILFFGRI